MHFLALLTLGITATASALPPFPYQKRDTTTTTTTTQEMQKRDAGSILLCTSANFTGTCVYEVYPINTCVTLPANLTADVSSVRPDEGAECMLMQGHCNDEMPYRGEITYPGIADLRNVTYDNIATSYICLKQF